MRSDNTAPGTGWHGDSAPARVLGAPSAVEPDVSTLAAVVERLRARTKASRVTLRQDLPGEHAFPVTHEALAHGVVSLMDERTVDLRTQPVVAELARGHQVVQDDCRTAYDDAAFHRMRQAYGGLAAQIVTPVMRNEQLVAIVSVHQLGAPRTWTREEIAAATLTADEVERLL